MAYFRGSWTLSRFFRSPARKKVKNICFTWGFTRHGEKGGDPESRSSGHRVDVHPEGDPGDDDNEDGGQVGLDHVKAQRPFQVEFGKQAAVVAWKV